LGFGTSTNREIRRNGTSEHGAPWTYVYKNGGPALRLSFAEIRDIPVSQRSFILAISKNIAGVRISGEEDIRKGKLCHISEGK
jgi:hypothetical protein